MFKKIISKEEETTDKTNNRPEKKSRTITQVNNHNNKIYR